MKRVTNIYDYLSREKTKLQSLGDVKSFQFIQIPATRFLKLTNNEGAKKIGDFIVNYSGRQAKKIFKRLGVGLIIKLYGITWLIKVETGYEVYYNCKKIISLKND